MNQILKRTPGIYLVGFMASGKSTIGRMLADEVGWRFADLDEDIEMSQKRSVQAIFRDHGEEEFRRLESEMLRKRVHAIRCGTPLVLAVGGGAFVSQTNIDLLNDNGITVWVDAAFSVVKRRISFSDHRPLAQDPQKFAELYESRRSAYAKAHHHLVIQEDNSRQALQALLKLSLFD